MIKILLLTAVLLTISTSISAQEIEKCYNFGGLKNEETIHLEITNGTVAGEYVVERDYDPDTVDRYPFSGKVTGKVVTITFSNEIPEALPAKQKTSTWTMVDTATREYLKFTQFGKNYTTGKYSKYAVEYDSCGPVYGAMAAKAKIVKFAAGKDSATFPLTLDAHHKYAAFSISASKNQSLEITSPGNTIRVFGPDKKLYKFNEQNNRPNVGSQNAERDHVITPFLRSPGNFLVVLEIAGESENDRIVTFKIRTIKRISSGPWPEKRLDEIILN